jgi:hypothetical protein
MRDVTDKLLTEGIASFQKSFDGLLAGLEKRVAVLADAKRQGASDGEAVGAAEAAGAPAQPAVSA